MSQSRTRCIGREVHNDAIAVAYVAQEHGAEVTYLGALGTRQCAIDHLIRTRPSQATHLLFVYEAGPGGSRLYRSLSQKGHDCWGVAPSLMPNKPGDRVTTDRRDAVQLARLARSGELTAVSGPTVDDAAMRARSRAREDPISARKDATFRRKAFVLSQDRRDVGRANWGPAHGRGLSEVGCPPAAQHLVLQAYVRAVNDHTERLQRLEQALQEHVKAWRLPPGGEALQALRGGQFPVAGTMVAEIGDLTRFDSPRALLKCLGRIPAEYSTGAQRRLGSLPQAGTTHARRVLVEGAWASRYPAQVSRPLPRRLATQPKVLQDSSWTAQVRLWKRSRRLVARGKHATVVTVASARALAGFLGASAQEVPITPSGS